MARVLPPHVGFIAVFLTFDGATVAHLEEFGFEDPGAPTPMAATRSMDVAVPQTETGGPLTAKRRVV